MSILKPFAEHVKELEKQAQPREMFAVKRLVSGFLKPTVLGPLLIGREIVSGKRWQQSLS